RARCRTLETGARRGATYVRLAAGRTLAAARRGDEIASEAEAAIPVVRFCAECSIELLRHAQPSAAGATVDRWLIERGARGLRSERFGILEFFKAVRPCRERIEEPLGGEENGAVVVDLPVGSAMRGLLHG